jgi:hypothetical protein
MIRPRIRRGIIYVTTRDGRAATFGKLFYIRRRRTAVGLGSVVTEGGAYSRKQMSLLFIRLRYLLLSLRRELWFGVQLFQ